MKLLKEKPVYNTVVYNNIGRSCGQGVRRQSCKLKILGSNPSRSFFSKIYVKYNYSFIVNCHVNTHTVQVLQYKYYNTTESVTLDILWKD